MRVGFRMHRMDECDVVDMLTDVRQHAGDRFARLAAADEWPRALHQVAILTLKTDQIFFARQRLATVLFQRRLVLPQVHV